MTISEFLAFRLIDTDSITLTVSQVLISVMILVFTKIVLVIAKRVKNRRTARDKTNSGRYHSLYLILSYFIWVVAILSAIQAIGVQLNVLLAGGAALMVGIGLGLQSLFHDFVSGIIMLIEGTVEVGDIIEVDGVMGKVKRITLRNSIIFTQSEYEMIVPNHFFVSEKVINWTHEVDDSRFSVSVGVAYGTNTQKVIELLEGCPLKFEGISKTPKPFARFEDFGESSLDFKLYFWCSRPFHIEHIKGKIRLMIDQEFRDNGIRIPFPQRDVHMIPQENADKNVVKKAD